MKTGIVIPAYKEHESILQLVNDVRAQVADATIVVVDDSPDMKTVEVLSPLEGEKFHLIHRTSKGGRGSAVVEGLRYLVSQGIDFALEMDADFSHPPSQIPALFAKASQESLDLLIASRYMNGSSIKNWPLSRRLFSFSANHVARFVLRVPVSDYTNGFRVYSARAADLISRECGKLGTGFIALSEILVSIYYRGWKVGETPTVFVNRVRGESSLNSSEIRNAINGLIRIHGLKNELKRTLAGRINS
jgi:dolichol-phosphate mannosyltransferase